MREVQSEIDGTYDNMCSVILQKMKNQILQYSPARITLKRYNHCKSYWNDELATLWNDMRLKERAFLRDVNKGD